MANSTTISKGSPDASGAPSNPPRPAGTQPRSESQSSATLRNSLGRRSSTQNRISEILENAQRRAEEAQSGQVSLHSMARTRSYSQAPRLGPQDPSVCEADETSDSHHNDPGDTRPPSTIASETTGFFMRSRPRNYESIKPGPSGLKSPKPGGQDSSSSQVQLVGNDARQNNNNNNNNNNNMAATPKNTERWIWSFLRNFQSLELDNKGSTARDHLALERTFLAWLRTSLTFASIGIAITQLFRLNVSNKSNSPGHHVERLRSFGKPVGATFVAISIVTLLLGYQRYVQGQQYIMKGKFPACRGTILLLSFMAFSIMLASLVIVVALGKSESG